MQQSSLFTHNSASSPQFWLDDAIIEYFGEFIQAHQAQQWFEQIRDQTQWQQETITLFGERHLTPRLSCWIADQGMEYGYSNMTMKPRPWTPLLKRAKKLVERKLNVSFNSVLLNFYRDGQDSNAWHSDDEAELGESPVIASLSLGAPRDFQLRHKIKRSQRHKILLQNGSLLLMAGTTQQFWQHQVPKRASAQPRINLTFRMIQ